MTDVVTTKDLTSAQFTINNTSVESLCFRIRFNETDYLPWENPADVVGPEVESYAGRFKLTLLTFFLLIGVPANVINMAVFFKQGLQDRVNLCLFAMSAADAMFLISSMFLNGENVYLHFSTGATKAHSDRFMVNNNLVFLLSSGFFSAFLSAVIACERCYCVLRPLKYHTLMRTRTMVFITVFAAAIYFSLFYVVCFKYRVGCLYDPVTGLQITSLIEGEFYNTHRDLIDGIDSFILGAGSSGGVMTTVVVATIVTSIKLRQITSWRSETSSSHPAREVALTRMLIASSVFFIITTVPTFLVRAVSLFLPDMSAGAPLHNFYLSCLWISEGFNYMNFTFNFFIYYMMGSRYRETLWALFGKNGMQKSSDK
ncbi:uncharacterized protein LOC143289702 [Babylonia areolata]|uniref:uncharacterized protein LOC143289702 n=1 Tax=Babylonia areolata TaxID=304850 RepID=UPI003FD5794A